MTGDLTEKTLDEIEQLVLEMEQRKYLAGYIFNFIHARNIKVLSEITVLSKLFRRQLAEQGFYIGCSFCATAMMAFKRNLSAGEILCQVNAVEAQDEKITNIVYRDGRAAS